MFKIGNVPEVEKLDLSSMQNDFIKSFVDGLVADRLIQKDLVILDPFEDDDQFLSFQIYYPQTPEKRVIIQIERPKSVIKVFVESETFYSGSGYEFLIHPTSALLTAKHDDIVEIVHGKIFFLAYNLLRLADGYEFFVQKNNEELETKHPMIAIYETFVSPIDQNSTILFNEPHIETECTDVVIQIHPDEKLVSITGDGMSLGSIKLLEIFVSLSYLYSDMAVEYSC